MARGDGRRAGELRPVEIIRGYTRNAAGSVLIRAGNTHVLCTACWENKVPKWRAGSGSGWVTAEYDMLPGSTSQRRPRNRGRIDGRTQEIQRLIGRSLRAVVDMDLLGENSILLDCDVLQADGGTRTAAITGAYVAMCDAIKLAKRNKWIEQSPSAKSRSTKSPLTKSPLTKSAIREAVAAVSVGRVKNRLLLDLSYQEDVAAEVDMNVVMTASGRFVEVQGTGEEATFSRAELDKLLRLAGRGIKQLLESQQKALRRRK